MLFKTSRNAKSVPPIAYKLVMLGDGGVGKTALTLGFCQNLFIETYDPTIEDSHVKRTHIDGDPCLVDILDTAGQEEYTALRDQWMREGQGFLIVYSITSRVSFERAEAFHAQISRVTGQHPVIVPVVLVGNKCDMVGEREIMKEEGQALAHRLGCAFVESSAKTSINVERAYFTVVRMIREQNEEANRDSAHKERSTCNIL